MTLHAIILATALAGGRFGTVGQVAVSMDGDLLRVAVYGDAPVVHLKLEPDVARTCFDEIAKGRDFVCRFPEQGYIVGANVVDVVLKDEVDFRNAMEILEGTP